MFPGAHVQEPSRAELSNFWTWDFEAFISGDSQTAAPGPLGSGPEQLCHLTPVCHTIIIFCVSHRIKWLGSCFSAHT